jgi:hypothetical protein
MISDGCGQMLTCGSCGSPQTCGGGGTANVCGCTPIACGARNCGTISDGCGGTPSCGTCTQPQSCGGAGVPNVCGCTPTTCAAQGKNCGTIPDGCGLTLTCGTCTSPESCGGSGVGNVCGCTPLLEPTPKGTTAVYPKAGPKTLLGQTFAIEGKGSIALDAVQLRGQYPSLDGGEVVSVGIYPNGKGNIPDTANPVWETSVALNKTDFYAATLTTKATALHTFNVAVRASLVPNTTYWLVVGSGTTVTLAGYDGTASLGDAISSGSAFGYVSGTGWTAIAGNDLFLVINPCK